MLQQTQVATVIPYFENFVKSFPSVADLANAELDQVLSSWAGLGYYARARNLHAAAIKIRDEFAGEFPSGQQDLESLPGVGRSTAGAIRAQAFSLRGVILDGNVRRVLCRFYAIDSSPMQADTQKQLWQLADSHTPNFPSSGNRHADYAQAIMDLGATVCARQPKCEICPLRTDCLANAQGRQNELPIKKAKQADKPVRYANMLIYQNPQGEVFLERRPPTGIWGGMLCPPVIYFDSEREAFLGSEGGLPLRRHTFSHFHLDFIPVINNQEESDGVLDSDDGLWYNLNSSAPGGLPAPVSKLFEELRRS